MIEIVECDESFKVTDKLRGIDLEKNIPMMDVFKCDRCGMEFTAGSRTYLGVVAARWDHGPDRNRVHRCTYIDFGIAKWCGVRIFPDE